MIDPAGDDDLSYCVGQNNPAVNYSGVVQIESTAVTLIGVASSDHLRDPRQDRTLSTFSKQCVVGRSGGITDGS